MTPFAEKLIMSGVVLLALVLAYFTRDDETIRAALLVMAGAPAGAGFYPRARERQLEKQVRDSVRPPRSQR